MALAKQEVMYIPANVPDTDDPQILKTFIAEELQKIAVVFQRVYEIVEAPP